MYGTNNVEIYRKDNTFCVQSNASVLVKHNLFKIQLQMGRILRNTFRKAVWLETCYD